MIGKCDGGQATGAGGLISLMGSQFNVIGMCDGGQVLGISGMLS